MAGKNFPDEGKAVIVTLDSLLKAGMSNNDWLILVKKDIKREKCIAGMLRSNNFKPNEVQNIDLMIENAKRYIAASSPKVSAVA
jgi:hypothetical protein